jgi:hypothetical protein
VWRDNETGAKTTYYHLNVKRRRERIDLEQAQGYLGTRKYALAVSKQNQAVVLVEVEPAIDNGESYNAIVDAGGTWRREKTDNLKEHFTFRNSFTPEQEKRWEKRFDDAGELHRSHHYMFSGAVLDNWNKFKAREDSRLSFAMARTDGKPERLLPKYALDSVDQLLTGRYVTFRKEHIPAVPGQRIVGVEVPHRDVLMVLKAFDAAEGAKFTPFEVFTQIMDNGSTFRLTGGMTLRRVTVKGERRIELVGVRPGQYGEVVRLGAMKDDRLQDSVSLSRPIPEPRSR